VGTRVGFLLALALGGLHGSGQETREVRDAQPRLARMPGAVWLTGYPLHATWLTTSSGTVRVQPSAGESRAVGGPWITPSMTHDGKFVATLRAKSPHPRRVAVATYSIAEGRWTEYAEGDFLDAVAISPDGAKLAYVGDGEETNCGYVVARVHVMDRKTLREAVEPMGPCIPAKDRVKIALSSASSSSSRLMGMSFSPQGDRLALGSGPIRVWDLDTNTEREIADGGRPAWSPDGKWIAYLNSSRDEHHSTLGMVHPDGSDDKILITLPRGSSFVETPVWSPDSGTLLLNQLRDGEKWTMDIRLLGVATLRLKTKFKDVPPVFGWAAEGGSGGASTSKDYE
jgi:Tol biopolymer transport system component